MKATTTGTIGQFRLMTGLTQSQLAAIFLTRRSYLAQVESRKKSLPSQWYNIISFLQATIAYGQQNFESELENSIAVYPNAKFIRSLQKEITMLEKIKLPKLHQKREEYLEKEVHLKTQYYMFCFEREDQVPTEHLRKLSAVKRSEMKARLSSHCKSQLWIIESKIEETEMLLALKKKLLERLVGG